MAANRPDFGSLTRRLAGRLGRDPRFAARAALGLLVVANLAAAAAAFRPWGGTESELRGQLAELSRQAQQRKSAVDRLRVLVQTMERTREDADQFFKLYFLDRRSASSNVLAELNAMAGKSGVRLRDCSFGYEPVEGAAWLSMMTINGSCEGTYGDLVEFVNAIDRSPRFLTIERLQATPLQSQPSLSITLRLDAFVRGTEETP